MYKALDIAKYVIDYCSRKGEPVTNLKLQKLLYYIQGGFYRETGHAAFGDDIIAWKLGPVVLPVYYSYNEYLADPIDEEYEKDELPDFSDGEKDIIESVIEELGSKTAWQLVNMTHKERPWKDTPKDKTIEKKQIKNYFCHL